MSEPSSRWHGDEWRWHRWSHPASGPRFIDVIEPPRDAERPQGERTVPFGFARVLAAPATPGEPLLWEGED